MPVRVFNRSGMYIKMSKFLMLKYVFQKIGLEYVIEKENV